MCEQKQLHSLKPSWKFHPLSRGKQLSKGEDVQFHVSGSEENNDPVMTTHSGRPLSFGDMRLSIDLSANHEIHPRHDPFGTAVQWQQHVAAVAVRHSIQLSTTKKAIFSFE